jgi:anhydro-N-acetylmuramic acid kinase
MTEITAKSIFNSLKENCNVKELGIYLCGGGSKNLFLMDLIRSKLPEKWKLYTTEALGIDPMLVETSTFAWLAKQRIENRKINLRSSTNAEISLTGEIFKG